MSTIEFHNGVDPKKEITTHLVTTIRSHIQKDEKILLFVPGGSAISIVADVFRELQNENLEKLIVTLTDERYGDIGHKDSNWQQLHEAGCIFSNAHVHPVLIGESIENTTEHFNNFLKEAIEEAGYSIGFFGIGADGHTAGLLPQSSAIDSNTFAAHFIGPDFSRITITPNTIIKLDEAVVYAVGETKWATLSKLKETHDIHEQPAQVLKQIPKVTIFTDYTG